MKHPAPKIFCQLGRAGDILNILPLVKLEADRIGHTVPVVVAREYARLLEGVSYARAIPFDGEFEDVIGGMRFTQDYSEKYLGNAPVVCSQIYGRGLFSSEKCWSFLRESWDRVPGAPPWGTLPLVFDRRDPAREDAVKETLLRGDTRPYIVVALSGTSSPFPYAQELLKHLRELAGKSVNIVDISGFSTDFFCDLLGLLEGAQRLVTADSGVLHLAHAVPNLHVLALITREPSTWHGSDWRRNQTRMFYDEAPECLQWMAVETFFPHARPAVIHSWCHFDAAGIDPETERRNAFARGTWAAEADLARCWIDAEFKAEHCKRDSGAIGDPRPIPYMKDILDYAAGFALGDDDIIAWTNGDSCIVPGTTGRILDIVTRTGAAFTHRWDFDDRITVPLANEAAARRGKWYPGTDAAFFTVGWWWEHRYEYPDMLLGREQNDEVLRQLIKRHGGLEVAACIYHEKHPSFWEHHGNRSKNEGNLYNKALARRWFLKTGYGPNDPAWWNIPTPGEEAVRLIVPGRP